MLFPFVLTFKKHINEELDAQKIDEILLCVKYHYLGKRISHFKRTGNKYSFNTDFSFVMSRSHILSGIESGSFAFDEHTSQVVYKFLSITPFIIIFCISLFFFIVSNAWSFSLMTFFFLYGFNVIIRLARLYFFVTKINYALDRLEFGKNPKYSRS